MQINNILEKIVGIAVFLLMLNPAPVWAEEGLADKIEKPLDKSIDTRQNSQKELDKWERERLRLQAEFEHLTRENEMLTLKFASLKKQETFQEELNASLKVREQESRKIAREIEPFLENFYARIAAFIDSDVPFLAGERHQRIRRLKKVLDDLNVGAAEKFRKCMEALFIEAEYGNTIEVYQDKISIENEEVLGDVFRLGRISLFFLSLDHSIAAYYNVAEKKWAKLDQDYASEIHAAIEMAGKRRPAELLCLPLGRMDLNKE